MDFSNYHYYDLYMLDRLQELHREMERERVIAQLPRRSSLWRRGVSAFGQLLVAFGTRLERVESREQTVVLVK